MAMLAILPILASVLLQQTTALGGGAESLAFPGFLPLRYVKGIKPIGDDRPNDVYEHLPLRYPVLQDTEVVIYPHGFDFEKGKDTEGAAYEVHDAEELKREYERKYGAMKGKFDDMNKMMNLKKNSKHNKLGKQHSEPIQSNSAARQNRGKQQNREEESVPTIQQSSYSEPPQQRTQPNQEQFRPRPAYSSQNVHPHFG